MAKAELAKQNILQKYPESRYALMLSNPNYIEELRQKQKLENDFYEATYNLYKTGRYREAIENAKKGLTDYKGSANEPRYQFILALSTGKTSDFKSFRNELNVVVELYPNAQVASTAKEMITFLDQREVQLASVQDVSTDKPTDKPTVSEAAVLYNPPAGEHLFVAVVPKKSAINQLKFNVVSFNVDYFLNLNLTVNNQELSQFFELITAESFKDTKEAMEYYNQIVKEEGLMGKLPPEEYSLFVISRQNFEKLKQEKSVANYLNFFRTNYK
jgi:tetratricopeptide (TPR) repeat protein